MIRRHNPNLPGGDGPAAQHSGSGGMNAYGGVYQQNPGVPPANWQYTGYQPQQQSVPLRVVFGNADARVNAAGSGGTAAGGGAAGGGAAGGMPTSQLVSNAGELEDEDDDPAAGGTAARVARREWKERSTAGHDGVPVRMRQLHQRVDEDTNTRLDRERMERMRREYELKHRMQLEQSRAQAELRDLQRTLATRGRGGGGGFGGGGGGEGGVDEFGGGGGGSKGAEPKCCESRWLNPQPTPGVFCAQGQSMVSKSPEL